MFNHHVSQCVIFANTILYLICTYFTCLVNLYLCDDIRNFYTICFCPCDVGVRGGVLLLFYDNRVLLHDSLCTISYKIANS